MNRSERSKVPDSGTVTVGLKLPNGLLLRVFKMEPTRTTTITGFIDEMRAVQVGGSVKLNGNRVPFGETPAWEIRNGYAFTPDVDAQFFKKWLEQNADHPCVENHLVHAEANPADLRAWTSEHKADRSGLEPLNQGKDPRNPAPASARNVEAVGTATVN